MWLISAVLVSLLKTALCQRVFCSQWWQEDQQREVAPLTSGVMKLHCRQSTLTLPIYYHLRGSETTSSHSGVHILINTQSANVLMLTISLEGTSNGIGCCGCVLLLQNDLHRISTKGTGQVYLLPYWIGRCSFAGSATSICPCGKADINYLITNLCILSRVLNSDLQICF